MKHDIYVKILFVLFLFVLIPGCAPSIFDKLMQEGSEFRFTTPSGESLRYWSLSEFVMLHEIEEKYPNFLVANNEDVRNQTHPIILSPNNNSSEANEINYDISNLYCKDLPCIERLTIAECFPYLCEAIDLLVTMDEFELNSPTKCEIAHLFSDISYTEQFQDEVLPRLGSNVREQALRSVRLRTNGDHLIPINGAWTPIALYLVNNFVKHRIIKVELQGHNGQLISGREQKNHLITFDPQAVATMEDGYYNYYIELEDKLGTKSKIIRTFRFAQSR